MMGSRDRGNWSGRARLIVTPAACLAGPNLDVAGRTDLLTEHRQAGEITPAGGGTR